MLRRSRRRAHLGGRSGDEKTQAIFARRQFEHGDCLSQRTLRLRHTMQLRNFDDDELLADTAEVAFFSEFESEAPAGTVTAATCDMLQSG